MKMFLSLRQCYFYILDSEYNNVGLCYTVVFGCICFSVIAVFEHSESLALAFLVEMSLKSFLTLFQNIFCFVFDFVMFLQW